MSSNLSGINVLFSGAWNAPQVTVRAIPSTRIIDRQLELCAQEAWSHMLTDATTRKRRLWDSETYRFEMVDAGSDYLAITVSTIPFSVRLGMNACTERVKALGTQYAPNGLYTSILVSTSDNHYVFIEKSDTFYTDKKYAWVGGVVSKSEKIITSGRDLFESACVEVTEELGVPGDSVVGITLRAGYVSKRQNVCVLFAVDVALTVKELRELFAHHNDGEAVNVLCVPKTHMVGKVNMFDERDRVGFAVLGLI